MGSGTTALAAINEGRKYIGIDKEKRSVDLAKKAIDSINSLAKEPEQMDLMIMELAASCGTSRDLALE